MCRGKQESLVFVLCPVLSSGEWGQCRGDGGGPRSRLLTAACSGRNCFSWADLWSWHLDCSPEGCCPPVAHRNRVRSDTLQHCPTAIQLFPRGSYLLLVYFCFDISGKSHESLQAKTLTLILYLCSIACTIKWDYFFSRPPSFGEKILTMFRLHLNNKTIVHGVIHGSLKDETKGWIQRLT